MNFIDLRDKMGGQGLNRGKASVLAFVFSDKFQVYSAKKFPGVIESTPLSKCFAGQGIKIPIRKDVSCCHHPQQSTLCSASVFGYRIPSSRSTEGILVQLRRMLTTLTGKGRLQGRGRGRLAEVWKDRGWRERIVVIPKNKRSERHMSAAV
jgi:hypothetical protein